MKTNMKRKAEEGSREGWIDCLFVCVCVCVCVCLCVCVIR